MYTPEQIQLVARELARSGGNVMAALTRLRNEYETFNEIGENTIRRMLPKKNFAELVAAEGAMLAQEREAGARLAERKRAENDAKGSVIRRLAEDEAILDTLRQRVELELAAPEFDARLAVALYERLTATLDRRRNNLLPAVAEGPAASALVEAVLEELVGSLGQGRAREIIGKIRERYTAKLAEQAAAADDASGDTIPVSKQPETGSCPRAGALGAAVAGDSTGVSAPPPAAPVPNAGTR
jgi:hypothetical protein